MVKSNEIYRQKLIDKQNYGFSQKLILYICTQTINTSHYGTEKVLKVMKMDMDYWDAMDNA